MGSNLRDQIVAVKAKKEAARKIVDEAYAFFEDLEPKLEKMFQKKWKESFPKAKVHFLVASGCSEFYLYHINDTYPIVGGRWAKHQSEGNWEFHEHNTKFLDCPVPSEKLQEFMKYMEDETSLVVSLAECKLKTKESLGETEKIGNAMDLQCKYGPFEVLEEGKVWYTGWDISDPFVIGQFPDGHIEVWYATNGHGFGFDVQVEQNQVSELDCFYNYLESNEPDPIKTTKEQILASWKK